MQWSGWTGCPSSTQSGNCKALFWQQLLSYPLSATCAHTTPRITHNAHTTNTLDTTLPLSQQVNIGDTVRLGLEVSEGKGKTRTQVCVCGIVIMIVVCQAGRCGLQLSRLCACVGCLQDTHTGVCVGSAAILLCATCSTARGCRGVWLRRARHTVCDGSAAARIEWCAHNVFPPLHPFL